MTKELFGGIVVLLLAAWLFAGMISESFASYPTQQRNLQLALPEVIAAPQQLDVASLHHAVREQAGSPERNPFNLSSDVVERGMTIPLPSPQLPFIAPPSMIMWEEE